MDASAGPAGTPQFRAVTGASFGGSCGAWASSTRKPDAGDAPRRLNHFDEHLGGVAPPCGLPELWATRWTGLVAQLEVSSRPSARCRRKSGGGNQTSVNCLAGCGAWATVGQNHALGGN
jgi:hypothetical protein